MLQMKTTYRMLLAAAGCCLITACERDNGEETSVSEFGVVQTEYIVGWQSGNSDVEVLTNHTFDISLIDPDNGWLRILDSEAGTRFTGDSRFRVAYDTNDGFPRMEGILVRAGERADTVYVKQEGYKTPELAFQTQSIAVQGDGGQMTARLATNLYLDELDRSVTYTNDTGEEWISDLDLENGYFIMQFAANPDPEALRRATITLEFTDGWGETARTTLYITQANARNEFGTEISFAEARDLAGVVNKDVYIEGRIVSEPGNGNCGENPLKTATSIDYTETYRTAYIQSLDGTMGFMIKTATEADNVFQRYSKVRILLRDATIRQEVDPYRYIIENVTSLMLLSSEAGSAGDIPEKKKHYNELTDDDLYTWVTLLDCELPVRKGSLTPINEGYARNTGANRATKFPLLVRDCNGDSFYLMTNTTCLYRRDGTMLPYGQGSISGVLVHEYYDQFNWLGDLDMGYIGRYQIRHLSRSDIALAEDFSDSFSALLTEYRYGKLESYGSVEGKVYRPTTGDNGYLSHTCPTAKGEAGSAIADASYLGPIGNKDNLDKTGPTSGIHEGNINGNGVVENGMQMCTSSATNSDGKGNVSAEDYSAWTNACAWWNTETDRSEAWLLHFSTEGIDTDVLSLQVAMQNRTYGGGPRYIRVDWSEHGDNTRTDWETITEFQLPDIVNWTPTQLWQCAGYKNIDIPLPLELLGREEVCIRFAAANKKSGSTTEFDSEQIGNGSVAFSYIGVRYNK